MVQKVTNQFIAAFLLACLASPAFGDANSDHAASEAAVTAETSAESGQTAVVVLTDPEIAAVEDEEPDCE